MSNLTFFLLLALQVKRLTRMYYQQQAKSQHSCRDLKSSDQIRENTQKFYNFFYKKKKKTTATVMVNQHILWEYYLVATQEVLKSY